MIPTLQESKFILEKFFFRSAIAIADGRLSVHTHTIYIKSGAKPDPIPLYLLVAFLVFGISGLYLAPKFKKQPPKKPRRKKEKVRFKVR